LAANPKESIALLAKLFIALATSPPTKNAVSCKYAQIDQHYCFNDVLIVSEFATTALVNPSSGLPI
jgi:hypothetical protein